MPHGLNLLYDEEVKQVAAKTGTDYSVSSLVVPKMEEEFSGTGAVKNSK